jgi:hypothetical protein
LWWWKRSGDAGIGGNGVGGGAKIGEGGTGDLEGNGSVECGGGGDSSGGRGVGIADGIEDRADGVGDGGNDCNGNNEVLEVEMVVEVAVHVEVV